ncbi:MAG: MFS transporter, partial [Thermoanaerobaculia bacterium]
ISGWGWALGYAGGLLALVVALFALIRPEVPLFGFSTENGENIRATNLLVAAWFAVFSLPIFLWVREDKSRITTSGSVLDASFKQLATTLKEIREYKQIFRFLIARLVYNDGLVTIFAFGGIYAAGTFGFTLQEIMIFGIVLNVAAGLGAFVLGFLDDRLGGKRTIQISLWGLSIATLIAVLAPHKWMFWVAGIMVGIFAGPTQSASRSLMGRFVPPDKENEFFGFFAFSGKATAFLGPFMLGLLTQIFGTQRAGISIVLALFVLGFLLLRTVDEEEGIRAAERPG